VDVFEKAVTLLRAATIPVCLFRAVSIVHDPELLVENAE
jgi:hypothetical protein